jgi:hypothetical protein
MSIALIVCIVGGVVYLIGVLAKSDPTQLPAGLMELGRLAFVAGLLAFLLKG